YVYLLFSLPRPSPTEIYTLSLHDALPISQNRRRPAAADSRGRQHLPARGGSRFHRPAGGPDDRDHHHSSLLPQHRPAAAARSVRDRKSTRLNSSHVAISYAVFCLKKKNKQ